MTDWIDLSRRLGEGISVYPGDPFFQARTFADHATDGFRGTRLSFGSHIGTHLDAPFHYFVDGETLDSFPLDFFFGDGAVLNLTNGAADSSKAPPLPATISVVDLEPFEPIFDAVPFVFLRTDWSSRFGEPDFYAAFPSLTPSAADWLADFPKLRILGLETPSIVALPTTSDASSGAGAPLPAKLEKTRLFDAEFLPKSLSDAAENSPTSTADAALDAKIVPNDETAPAPPLDELELCADAECHRILLGRRPPILILEGLVDLTRLPSFAPPNPPKKTVPFDPTQTVEIAAFPLAFERSDGCPVRVAARRKPRLRVIAD